MATIITVPEGTLLDLGAGKGVKINGVQFDIDGVTRRAADGMIKEGDLLSMSGSTREAQAENFLKKMADDFAAQDAKKPVAIELDAFEGTVLLKDKEITYTSKVK